MINISTNKPLDIITPERNRALGVILKQLPAKELDTLVKERDLKSILTSLFKDTPQSLSSSDKTLLELAKNNPTLKELGSASATLKELLLTLKSDKSAMGALASLKDFLLDMKEINEPVLKQKFQNSGVFLESKLKEAQNPRFELKSILVLLDNTLQKSTLSVSKSLMGDIKDLLSHPVLKEAPKSAAAAIAEEKPAVLRELSQKVGELASKLQSRLIAADIVFTKTFEAQSAKLENLSTPLKLSAPQNFGFKALEDALMQINAQLTQSSMPQTKGLMESLEKIFDALKTIQQDVAPQISEAELFAKSNANNDVKNLLASLKNMIKEADPLFSKQSFEAAAKLTEFALPQKLSAHESTKELLSNDLKSVLLGAKEELAKSSLQAQSQIQNQVEKLLLQIDYFQLLSHLSNSSCLYLPFAWDEMQEGSIAVKKDKDDKFYCDIELKLKEYGEVKLRLALYEKTNLNIHVYSDNISFKEAVGENISQLRSALIDSGITPKEIRILQMPQKKPNSPYTDNESTIDMGFEIKA